MDLCRTPDLTNNIGGLYLIYPNLPVSSGPNPCALVPIPVLRSVVPMLRCFTAPEYLWRYILWVILCSDSIPEQPKCHTLIPADSQNIPFDFTPILLYDQFPSGAPC